jgi:RsiW-degrading membrane proteinase PrsW (M82 family)
MATASIRLVLIQGGFSVLPVILFLLALELVDTYKLLALRRVVRCVVVGCGVAVVCYLLNTALYGSGVIAPGIWARSGAPVLEEVAKALFVVWLLRTNRVGFMVDTAISGFAVGAGFAVVENLSYLPDLSAAALLTSAIRGLGTAMMHGGTTAIFGTISVNLIEIRGSRSLGDFLPGLAIAMFIHVLYNQPLLRPVTSAVIVLLTLPAAMAFIFWRSEEALEKWLGTKLDKDIDLLQIINSGTFSSSHAGSYLRSLESTFAPEVLGDMLCYVQLSLELSARAKGDLLRREMGFPVTSDPELPGQLKELIWLESRIGRAGKLALAPLVGQSRRDIWELQRLAEKPVEIKL